METKIANEIVLTLIGKPVAPANIATSTGHGDGAYVCTCHDAITQLFKSLSIWGGSTKTFVDSDGNEYKYSEMSCKDRSFFKSDVFERICKPYHVRIVIHEDHSETRNFFSNLRQL